MFMWCDYLSKRISLMFYLMLGNCVAQKLPWAWTFCLNHWSWLAQKSPRPFTSILNDGEVAVKWAWHVCGNLVCCSRNSRGASCALSSGAWIIEMTPIEIINEDNLNFTKKCSQQMLFNSSWMSLAVPSSSNLSALLKKTLASSATFS